MVKVILELLDVLSPSSRNKYKQHIINRFDELAKQQQQNLDLEQELETLRKSGQHLNPDGATDRFELIRLYTTKTALANKAGISTQSCNSDDESTSSNNRNKSSSGPQLVRDYLYSSEEAIEQVLELELTTDAPIIRCLLGLHELPDCTLWLLSRETTAFCSMILRTLPVSPFFESVSRIWRILDVFDPESNGAKFASRSDLFSRMGALGHEALVQVSESKRIAEDAANDGWIGIHLIQSQMNREASVEQFSPSRQSKNRRRHQTQSGSGNADDDDANVEFAKLNPLEEGTSTLRGCAVPIVAASFAGPSSSSSSKFQSEPSPLVQAVKKNFAVARGITALGHVILVNVPELAENVKANMDTVTPLLFTQQATPIRQNFCFCKCFWTGVGVSVFGTAAAIVSLAGIGLVVMTTIRTFSGAVKGVKKN